MNYPRPKLLWLESGDLYTIRRGIEAGRQQGIVVDHLEMLDLKFAADGKEPLLGTRVGKEIHDLTDYYDGVIMRSFMPNVSEALTVARLFKEAGKVVVDKSLTDEGYAMSKMHDYILLAREGIGVPVSYQSFNPKETEEYAAALGFPCILKGTHGSQGRNVFKADHVDQLRRMLWRQAGGELLVQEYLPAEFDFRVMVVGYKALPVFVKRIPQPGEFRTNFDFKEESICLNLSDFPELRALAEQAAGILRREFAGVDIRVRGETPLVLEVNRRPGFKAFEEATQYDVAGAFVQYVAELCTGHDRI